MSHFKTNTLTLGPAKSQKQPGQDLYEHNPKNPGVRLPWNTQLSLVLDLHSKWENPLCAGRGLNELRHFVPSFGKFPSLFVKYNIMLKLIIHEYIHKNKSYDTRKDMALSAISMNSALADKEFVLSLHHKLHVSTCINKPNDVHKHNQSIIHSINQSF